MDTCRWRVRDPDRHLLEQYDRAEEHYLTFLETFTQPDPEYVWMREEAQQALETLARGR